MSKKNLRPVDRILDEYNQWHSHPSNRVIQYIAVPLLLFGFLGLVWSVPFPYLGFLGKYNGFVNWASFIIAFSIYYYYRLSPVLSYATLLLVFALSAGIVSLEKLEKQGFYPMWQVCFSALAVAVLLQSVGYAAEGRFPGLMRSLKNLLIAPVWLAAEVLKKLRVKT